MMHTNAILGLILEPSDNRGIGRLHRSDRPFWFDSHALAADYSGSHTIPATPAGGTVREWVIKAL